MGKEYIKDQITVIVPCYKAGKYLDNFCQDLLAQTFTHFKVFMVNDGDRGQEEILAAMAKRDSRIEVIWKENGGAASARNVAIDMVDTEWLVFADADDRFRPDYLQNLYDSVTGSDVAMGIGGYTQFFVRNNVMQFHQINIEGKQNVMSFKDAYELILPSRILAYPWNKIFKTELIQTHNIYMDASMGVIHDFVFNMDVYKLIDRVSLIPDSGYIYYMEESGSLVATYDKNFERDRRRVIQMLDELNHMVGWPEERCEETKKSELINISRMIITNLFKKKSPLTLTEIKARIQKEVFEKQDIMDAVRGNEHPSNYDKINKFLLLNTNPWVVALFYKCFFMFRMHFGNTYAHLRSILNR